ncbi:hypothetical protein LBWT_2730 [Leptolyngbya boryana IAM M-101]|jgi:hypothetical protein|uniref:hypothetical protein n=1 Tax=Leptolyngbya boryana TaxID=1184 RepID=UPI001EFB8E49|nr:hypothetical protein [Leptolyngbya boryana]ULP30524.1 hypothetical protein MCP04_01840 [Leptolyngbya boryana IU 594]BAS54382.1 hypothetical protein LBWT_2730 [Leptolyngbya boryana IAM M-101]BAS60730.1 hypothetical protein LBDG_02730 [Leptolyngbya boryana dg5]
MILSKLGFVRSYRVLVQSILPSDHSRRNEILRLLAGWKIRIDLGNIQDFSRQEALIALSEAFLAWEQQTQEQSK